MGICYNNRSKNKFDRGTSKISSTTSSSTLTENINSK